MCHVSCFQDQTGVATLLLSAYSWANSTCFFLIDRHLLKAILTLCACFTIAMFSRCLYIIAGISPAFINYGVEVSFTFLSVARVQHWRRRWFIVYTSRSTKNIFNLYKQGMKCSSVSCRCWAEESKYYNGVTFLVLKKLLVLLDITSWYFEYRF